LINRSKVRILDGPPSPETPGPAGRFPFRGRHIAKVAELVDALDLGSSAARRGGSSPPFRTSLHPPPCILPRRLTHPWGNPCAAAIPSSPNPRSSTSAAAPWCPATPGP